MSKAVIPIKGVALEDPVTRLSRPTAWGIPQGGIVYTYQQVKATGSGWGQSGSNVNFVAPPPSPEIIVDRRVMCQVQFFLTFSATPLNGMPVLQLGTNDAPRAFPLMQAINTVSATINNNTITALMDPVIALMRYNLEFGKQQQGDYIGTPCMLDQYQDYDFWNGNPVQAPAPFNFANTGGSLRNPMESYGDVMINNSRGGFLLQVVQNPVGDGITKMTAAIIMTVTEPFFMLPFAQWGEEPGFYGIQTLNISFTLNQNWWLRTWSQNPNKVGAIGFQSITDGTYQPTVGGPVVAMADVTGNIPNAPQLLFRYITPSPIKALPALMEYPYSSIQVFTTPTTPTQTPSVFTTAALNQTTSSSIQFNTIPDMIYIYLFRQQGDRNHVTSDTFGAIQSISVNFMNQTGLLASATQWDLYKISQKNGFQGTFDQWRWQVGSVLCLKPGLDLGLEPSLAPGMNGLYNFQVTVNYVNPGPVPVTYLLYVVPITQGLVTIKDNGTVTQTGLLTRADVLAAQAAPSMGYNEAVKLVGGHFFGDLRNILSRGADTAMGALPYIRNAASVFSNLPGPFGNVARTVRDISGKAYEELPGIRKRFGFGYGAGMYGAGFQGDPNTQDQGQGMQMQQAGAGQVGGANEYQNYGYADAPGMGLDAGSGYSGAEYDDGEDPHDTRFHDEMVAQAGRRRRAEEESRDAGPPNLVSRRPRLPMNTPDPRDTSAPQFR